jgi:hypothetical protein
MRSTRSSSTPLMPEVDAYIHLLVLIRLIDSERNDEAVTCSGLYSHATLRKKGKKVISLYKIVCKYYDIWAFHCYSGYTNVACCRFMSLHTILYPWFIEVKVRNSIHSLCSFPLSQFIWNKEGAWPSKISSLVVSRPEILYRLDML